LASGSASGGSGGSSVLGGRGGGGGRVVVVEVVVVGAAATGVVVAGVVVVAVVGVVIAGAIGAVVGAVVAGTAGGAGIGRSGTGPVVGSGSAVAGASVADASGAASVPGMLGAPRRGPGSFEGPGVTSPLARGSAEDAASADGSGGAVVGVAERAGVAAVAVRGKRPAAAVVGITEVGGGSGAGWLDSGPCHTASSVNKVRSSTATMPRPTIRFDSRRRERLLPAPAD